MSGAGGHRRSAPSVSSWEPGERGASSKGGGLPQSLAGKDSPVPPELKPASGRRPGGADPDADAGGRFRSGPSYTLHTHALESPDLSPSGNPQDPRALLP